MGWAQGLAPGELDRLCVGTGDKVTVSPPFVPLPLTPEKLGSNCITGMSEKMLPQVGSIVKVLQKKYKESHTKQIPDAVSQQQGRGWSYNAGVTRGARVEMGWALSCGCPRSSEWSWPGRSGLIKPEQGGRVRSVQAAAR